MCIIDRYYAKDPKVGEIKKIYRKYVEEHNRKFNFFYKTCKWKLHFTSIYTGFVSANTEHKRLFLLGCEPCDMLETYLFRRF